MANQDAEHMEALCEIAFHMREAHRHILAARKVLETGRYESTNPKMDCWAKSDLRNASDSLENVFTSYMPPGLPLKTEK